MSTVDDNSIPGGGPAPGDGVGIGLPWFVDVLLLLLVLAIVAAPIAGVVSAVRGRKRGGGTPWATAALVVVRFGMLYAVVALIAATTDRSASWVTRSGAEERGGRLTVPALTSNSSVFCKLRTVQNVDGPEQIPGVCGASRGIERSPMPNGEVPGYVTRIEAAESSGRHRAFVAINMLDVLFLLLGLLALERILTQSSGRKEPFARASVWWLRCLALVVFVDGWLLETLSRRMSTDVVQGSQLNHLFGATVLESNGPGFGGIAVAILILVVAEVWRQGIHLREDVEATV